MNHTFSAADYMRMFEPELLEWIHSVGFEVFDGEDGSYLEGEHGIMSVDLFRSIAQINGWKAQTD